MANLRFNVRVFVENPAALPEIQERMKDLTPAFDAIYLRWVAINEQKFDLAKGGEVGGAQIFEELWAGLSTGYLKEKHPAGAPKRKVSRGSVTEYPDWLMVRTGELRNAMINPEALFHDLEPGQAVFGMPNDPDLADIVRGQAGPRQHERHIIFLSLPDMNAIRMIMQDYLGLGGDFADLRFAKGVESAQLGREVEDMEAGFEASA